MSDTLALTKEAIQSVDETVQKVLASSDFRELAERLMRSAAYLAVSFEDKSSLVKGCFGITQEDFAPPITDSDFLDAVYLKKFRRHMEESLTGFFSRSAALTSPRPTELVPILDTVSELYFFCMNLPCRYDKEKVSKAFSLLIGDIADYGDFADLAKEVNDSISQAIDAEARALVDVFSASPPPEASQLWDEATLSQARHPVAAPVWRILMKDFQSAVARWRQAPVVSGPMSVQQVAEILGVSVQRVYQLISAKKLQKKTLVSFSSLKDYVDSFGSFAVEERLCAHSAIDVLA